MIITKYLKLRKKYNTLELEYKTLKESVKTDLYKNLLHILDELEEVKRLRDDNKHLRKKVKLLKRIIREGDTNCKKKTH